MTRVNEQQRDQQSSPAFRTLEQKIDEFANGIRGIRDIIWDKKEIILQQLARNKTISTRSEYG